MIRTRHLLAAVALIASLALAAPAHAADPVIAAAGDIACDSLPTDASTCQQQATSNLIFGAPLAAVLPLGDTQYEDGALSLFQQFYDPTWGRLKAISHPAVGNHEYRVPGAADYFTYFGPSAGSPAQGYYSFDVGAWHLISLNSNCKQGGGCAGGGGQETWLKADLAAHKNSCTLAYWHHPHFSSGTAGDDDRGANPTGAFWRDLYSAGADVVLNGHDHDYERFAPQTPNGQPDAAFGVREIVAGTGGRSHGSLTTQTPNSELFNADTFGVLQLTLAPASYSWRFVPTSGGTFTDSGSGACHGSPYEPLLKLGSRRHTRLSRTGSLKVSASCAAACTTRARAVVTIRKRKIRSLVLRRPLTPEVSHNLRVKFSRQSLRKIRRALRKHRRLPALIIASATAPESNEGAATVSLRLRR